MSGVPKVPNLKPSKIELKNKLDKTIFLNALNIDRLNALKKYLKEVYGISEEDIKCESDNYCVAVKTLTEDEIEAWYQYYEETEEFARSKYDYAIGENGKYYYVHIIERFNGSEELEVEIKALS